MQIRQVWYDTDKEIEFDVSIRKKEEHPCRNLQKIFW